MIIIDVLFQDINDNHFLQNALNNNKNRTPQSCSLPIGKSFSLNRCPHLIAAVGQIKNREFKIVNGGQVMFDPFCHLLHLA